METKNYLIIQLNYSRLNKRIAANTGLVKAGPGGSIIDPGLIPENALNFSKIGRAIQQSELMYKTLKIASLWAAGPISWAGLLKWDNFNKIKTLSPGGIVK